MRLVMLRHGATVGNEEHRYVGRRTDEPLSDLGRAQCARLGTFGQVGAVYTSPLLRARQTAQLCFPAARIIPVEGLAEYDFGVFEGRSAQQMEHDVQYTSWVNGGCMGPCPGGESFGEFSGRSNEALVGVLTGAYERGEEQVVVVAHGGNIMAAFNAFVQGLDSNEPFYHWHVGNCEGYAADVEFVEQGEHLCPAIRSWCVMGALTHSSRPRDTSALSYDMSGSLRERYPPQ